MGTGRWFDSNYKRRVPVNINVDDGSGGVSVDVSFYVPSDFDAFWDVIRSDGKDVVLCGKDGVKVAYQLKTFDYANKIMEIEGDAITQIGSRINVMWLYFNFPAEGTDHQTAFSSVSPKSGSIYLGGPSGPNIVGPLNSKSVVNTPLVTITKDPDDEIDVWFSTSGLFEKRVYPTNKRKIMGGPGYFEVESLDSEGADSTDRYDYVLTRYIQGWVRVRAKAGSDDTDYALRCLVRSDSGTLHVLSCLIKVRKLLPESTG